MAAPHLPMMHNGLQPQQAMASPLPPQQMVTPHQYPAAGYLPPQTQLQQQQQFLAQQQQELMAQQQMYLQQQQQQQQQQQMTIAQETAALWLKIDQLHLNYLKAEETTKKIDIRKKLEGYIHHYLCLVPQDRKFCNSMTAEVISDSCRWIPDFSALKAAQAFEALETYAANLINQPWRKEFREIKQYGGFYTHNIASALYGADRVFHQMGYLAGGQQVLSLEPGQQVDQDRVVTVARDCILAYVECQIAVGVMQGVNAQYPCSWSEVLNFRRDHVGTPEQAVRAIVYFKNQQQYQSLPSSQVPPSSMFQVGGEAGRTSAASVSASAAASTAAFIPTLLQGLTNNLSSPSQSNTVPPTPPAIGKLIDLSTSDLDSGSGGAQQIPLTIKHLEQEEKRKSALVDPRALLQSPDGSDTWDYVYKTLDRIGYNTKDAAAAAGGSERLPDALELLNKVTQARQRALEREGQGGGGAGQESPQWSQEEQELLLRIQRTQLDDGDRGAEERPQPPTTSSTQDGGRSSSGLFLTESPSERDEPDAVHPRFRRDAGAASVDNSSPNQDSVGGNNNVPSSNNINSAVSEDYSTVVRGPDGTKKSLRHSRPLEPPSDQVQQQQQQSNKDRRPNLSETDGGRRSRAHDEEVLKQQQQHPRSYSAAALSGLPNWSCYACTFENGPGVDICEMCGKSRPASSASATGESSCGEEDSLGSAAAKGGGGREGEGRVCPRCTLVNPKGARVCEACEERLGGGRGRRSGGGGGGGGSRRQKR